MRPLYLYIHSIVWLSATKVPRYPPGTPAIRHFELSDLCLNFYTPFYSQVVRASTLLTVRRYSFSMRTSHDNVMSVPRSSLKNLITITKG